MEVMFMPKSYKPEQVESTIKQIMAEVKNRRPDLKADYLSNLEKEMRSNEIIRDEFAKRMNIHGKVSDGTVFYANGREAESITLKSGTYKRILSDGTYELFDAQGHMTHMYDKNNNSLKLTWDKDQLISVADTQN